MHFLSRTVCQTDRLWMTQVRVVISGLITRIQIGVSYLLLPCMLWILQPYDHMGRYHTLSQFRLAEGVPIDSCGSRFAIPHSWD